MMLRSLQKPLGTLFILVSFAVLWDAIGEPLIAALAASSPSEISAITLHVGVAGFSFVFLTQVISALLRPTTREVTALSPYVSLAGRGSAAREAAVALLGPGAGKRLDDMAATISKGWASRARPDYKGSCRHEAAHAVVAHHFGAIVLKSYVNLDGNGQMHWATPPMALRKSEDHWMRLCIALAGSTLDHSEGRHNSGSSMDTTQLLGDAVALLATGEAPPGFDGPLTMDTIIGGARALVDQVLTDRGDPLNQIAARLEESGELPGHEINRLLRDSQDA